MALATAQLAPKHWVYLDAGRTHELHAQSVLRDGEGLLVTTEFPSGSRDPSELVRAQTPIRGEAELVALLGEIEERLAHTGRYFRTEASDPRWMPIAARHALDLRAHEATIPGGEMTGARMRFHHFHGEDGAQDRLLISMPRPGMTGRHVLAQMSFEFPHVDAGELEVLHTRLAPTLLASAVAKEHVEAPRKGLRKLFDARDYENAYGSRWAERASVMFKKATARFIDRPAAPPEPVAPLRKYPVPGDLGAMKMALSHARIEAIRSRYVDPVTEAQLVEGGEHIIRRHVNKLRARAPHQQLYDLSLLEATLLCEYAISAQMWDLAADEGAKLLRYVNGRA